MRYEPLDLRILDAAFRAVGDDRIAAWVRSEPTGAFSRRAWFLFETLLDRRLDLPDARAVVAVPALDPRLHVTASGILSSRHRVEDNLTGSRRLCPIVRRTKRLEDLLATDLRGMIAALLRDTDPEVLRRALSFLYTKETRSSFAIEGEEPSPDRAGRFVAALRSVRDFDVGSEADFVRLQNLIVDPRYRAAGWRDTQVFIGETAAGYREIVHCVFPRPQDVPDLMEGLRILAGRVAGLDPVVAAALVSFASVFIHPFGDRNGRIHRYLVHRILAAAGLTPEDLLLPVSATMERDRRAYDAALETFSRALMPHVAWRWVGGEGGGIEVTNDTAPLYRYFDATRLVEYLWECVIEAVERDLREEVEFLDVHGRALAAVREVVDMPDRHASRLVRLILQNGGRLSRTKRATFAELTDDEIAAMEAAVRDARRVVPAP